MPKPPPNSDSMKSDYMAQTFRNQFYPKNEYEHAAMLVDSQMPNEANIENWKHSDLVDRNIQTSTINQDQLMNGLQMDMPFLHSALSMAQRNAGLVQPFKIMYHSWRDSIIITKAHQGMENLAQHATGAKHTPQPFGQGGFGAGLYAEQEKKKGIGESIRGFFGGKKQ